ncbi:SctV: non flagellar T3S system conserved transmembrane protein. FHIPEP (flagella/HR/invasion proteins export pore) family [Cupriavidus taiwanensis]|uniref:type III secretion system export apparatus subunit SctV n=1 Tax=Cupriavidus taiwanensis TaxID=164546 RepID=UPI000E1774E7|nr:type III secretion system export apparatus subunit SctV [Cupriavidus taiwanensis]SOZ17745.1 SctV: non flagellar T3S system conserved transmembrane protein. FHIPEP (flagella/HR/invasion proteins export pore) family [Cupriavidus taiwanensis]SOZ30330.1 SctV: non flagellar T3S system conserved transmembrane protein. FHIPEP (flagella/HR/invasion proteins export pore) family [Cupriavidus taiwanensis]SOZ49599.1 SctV: non flagellar T3S system conserved transmembrane protein. FHIPEP (flagella/HR/invas
MAKLPANLPAFPRGLGPGAPGLQQMAAAASRQSDLALTLLLFAVIALFVLPLPTFLLDLLLTVNLGMSLTLLIVATYIPSALSLSTFPSLLLFTTLFRLSLNIASTKLILLHADAGHIIDTFGKLIVGNNVVVGGVVFLIIAIVQFIVIAKGSERVAEVGARFALDAMPGKQMSIDADVRAGTITAGQAQERRRALEQECQLHGAMDGAMKFVKGDAIAGVVIALVNILAGITIGTLMKDMSIGEALQRYAILTIGDGMVSQIPSLLVSIAAGVVITRVSSDEERARAPNLGEVIGKQILAQPKALVVSGLAIAVFVVVPGFPKWTFGLMALVVAGGGYLLLRRAQRSTGTVTWIEMADADEGAAAAGTQAAVAPALALELDQALRGRIDLRLFEQRMTTAKGEVEAELGMVFPRLRIQHRALAERDAYAIRVQDVVASGGVLRPGKRLLEPGARARVDQGVAETGAPFGPFQEVVWVPAEPGAADGVRTLSCEEVLAVHVGAVIKQHAAPLLGIQDVQSMIHVIQAEAPDLVMELARVVPLQRITDVLRRLLQEGVPIRNLRTIFESLVTWAPKETDAIALTELVRVDLGRLITSRHVGANRSLDAVLFEPALEARVQGAIEKAARGNLLLLSHDVTRDIREQLRVLLEKAADKAGAAGAAGAAGGSGAARVVVVVSVDVRRYIKRLIEPVAPRIPVLSYQEVDEDVTLVPVGWIQNPAGE